MTKIKVIQVGLGLIGKGVTKALMEKKGIEIVGALDIDKDKVGKDLGDVTGVGRKLGIIVTDDVDSLFYKNHADVVLNATTYSPMNVLYQEITKPVEQGMNIITSSVEGSRPFYADPVIAGKLDKLLKQHGVTYLGTGDSTGQDRVLMALIEQCTKVRKIQLTQSGNSETLSPTAARTYGLGFTPEEYQRLIDNGSIARIPTPKQELAMLAERLGWQLDEIRERIEHFPGKGKKSIGTTMTFEGIKDGEVRIERISKSHPNAKRFCQIVVEGAPSFNLIYEVALCGSLTTVGCMVNAIPHVLCAPPGIMKILDLPLSLFAD